MFVLFIVLLVGLFQSNFKKLVFESDKSSKNTISFRIASLHDGFVNSYTLLLYILDDDIDVKVNLSISTLYSHHSFLFAIEVIDDLFSNFLAN